jgi:thioesterase domain-containing protein
VLYYADLARQMGVDQTFYGLQAAGFDGEQTPLCDLRAMAGRYVEEVLAMQRLGPYHLGGACMGGMVAFEMARQLLARGHEVGLLALIDTPPPAGRTLAGYYWLRLRRGWKYFVVDRARFHALRAWRRVSGAFRQLAASAAHASTVRPREAPRLASQAAPARPPDRHRARVHEANIRAMQTYRAAPYAGSLTLFLAEDSQPSERMRWMAAWQRLVTGAVVPIVVPGDHNSMVRAPLVEHLAQQLRARLDDVRGVSAIEAEPQCLPLPAIPEEQGGSEAQAA